MRRLSGADLPHNLHTTGIYMQKMCRLAHITHRENNRGLSQEECNYVITFTYVIKDEQHVLLVVLPRLLTVNLLKKPLHFVTERTQTLFYVKLLEIKLK